MAKTAPECLISLGKLAILICLALPADVFALDVTTALDPKLLGVGESSMLQIHISGVTEAEVIKLPQVDGVDISFSGMQRRFQRVNGKSWSGCTLSFSITPVRTGTFPIPAIAVKTKNAVVSSKPVTLVVSASSSSAVKGGTSRGTVRVVPECTISKNRAYSGEPLVLRYFVRNYGGLNLKIKGFSKPPAAKGFVIKEISEQIDNAHLTDVDGSEYVRIHAGTFVLVPAESGTRSAGGGAAVVTIADTNDIFSMGLDRELPFDAVSLSVERLPPAAADSATGNVGNFSLEIDYDKSPCRVFEEKKITVRIKGTGNFISLGKPQLENVPSGVKFLLDSGKETITLDKNVVSGEKVFSASLIPESGGTYTVGPFKLIFFNPATRSYEERVSEKITITAEGSASQQGLAFDADNSKKRSVPWVALFIALAACGLVAGGIVYYERKKHFSDGETVPPEKTHDVEEYEINTSRDYVLFDLKNAADQNKADHFLSLAEKAVVYLETKGWRDELTGAKELINAYKYGGKKLSQNDMIGFYQMLKVIYEKGASQ